MPVSAQCPSCKSAVQIADHLLGQKLRCGKCQNIFIVNPPKPKSPPPPAPAAQKPAPAPQQPAARKPNPVPQKPVPVPQKPAAQKPVPVPPKPAPPPNKAKAELSASDFDDVLEAELIAEPVEEAPYAVQEQPRSRPHSAGNRSTTADDFDTSSTGRSERRPQPRRRSREEEHERPGRDRMPPPGMSTEMIIALVAGGALLLVGLVVALMVSSGGREEPDFGEKDFPVAQRDWADRGPMDKGDWRDDAPRARIDKAADRKDDIEPPDRKDDIRPPRKEDPFIRDDRARPPVNPPPPPPRPLKLPPLPDPVAINAAPVNKETSVKLPTELSALRVGGGGRYLILHFAKTRKLGIFDTSQAKIVRYLPVSEEQIRFAAGMEKLIVYLPSSGLMQRYNLETGQREKSEKVDIPATTLYGFCMGHASSGPLLVSAKDSNAKLYDINILKPIPLPWAENRIGRQPTEVRLPAERYWAGATGRVFGKTGTYGQPNGVGTLVLQGGKIEMHREHKGTWYIVPGPNDRYIYPGGHGVVSTRVKQVQNVPFSMGTGSGFASHLYLPACHGPFYLHAQTIRGGRGGHQAAEGTISVFMHGSTDPLLSFPNSAVCNYSDWSSLKGIGIEYSIQLIPKAKLLVVVPSTRDELRLYPADLDKALVDSGRDFLLFTSAPSTTFKKGQDYSYQVEVKAKKMPVTFSLMSAPKGMAIDAKGQIRWTVPADYAEDRVDIILQAKDSGGQEVFQTFTLTSAP